MKQKMGVYFSPRMLHAPERVERAIQDARDLGYSWVCLHAGWHTTRTVADAIVHDVIQRAVAIAHRQGLKAMVDMTPEWWVRSYMDDHPEAAQWVTCRAAGTCHGGRFTVTGTLPNSGDWQIVFEEVSAAFCLDANGQPRRVEVEVEFEQFADKNGPGYALQGMLQEPADGPIVLYPSFAIYCWMDYAHPSYLRIQKELLEKYRDVPLDGIQWDEPGKANGLQEGYRSGGGFFELFRRRNGYDLKDRLIYLDEFTGTPSAARTRHDYYATLTDALYEAQRQFNEQARQIFGNIEFGVHHTWSGFHMDFRGGCFDYFKLGRNLTAAYTDCMWNGGAIAYNYYLADSLRKELRLRDAYVNDWSNPVTAEQISYYCRLKKLFKINWKNLYTGDYGDGLPLYPIRRLTGTIREEVGRLDEFDQLLGEEWLPGASTAVWHGWEGVAYLNTSAAIHDFYHANLWDFCEHVLVNSIWLDFVSTGAIEALELHGRSIRINGRRYDRLVLPWACLVTARMWAAVRQVAKAGLPVLFVGPPPMEVVDDGRNIFEEFADVAGVKPFTLSDYLAYYPFKERGKSRHCPVQASENRAHNATNETGVLRWTRTTNGAVCYLPQIYPGSDLVTLLGSFDSPEDGSPFRFCARNGMCRPYDNGSQADELLLAIAARPGLELDERLVVSDQTIAIQGGTFKLFHLKQGRLIERG